MENIIDSKGLVVKIGDKVRGEGVLDCNDGYQIDLTPIVTVRKVKDVIFFGGISMQNFRRFYKITKDYKPSPRF